MKHAGARRELGFTLVEVLVALVVMAVMAALAWRGVDGMLRARDATLASLDATTRLGTVMAQWEQDLQALYDSRSVPPIAFDGNTLRLARHSGNGVQMVAWSLHDNRWQRWASPVVTRAAELQEHWLRAQQLQGQEPEQLKLVEGVQSWQVFFYRDGRLSNAQSSGNLISAPAAAAPAASAASGAAPAVLRERLPEGVQLLLRVGAHTLKRDIALVPQS
jgi:general secretion pathway protein J